jgi:hypothetical protein
MKETQSWNEVISFYHEYKSELFSEVTSEFRKLEIERKMIELVEGQIKKAVITT